MEMRTFARDWLLLGLMGLVACGDAAEGRDPRAVPPPSAAADEAGGLGRFVRWGRDINLEENDGVLNVFPHMNLDPRGGFLVSDAAENQIRRYDRNGKLLAHFARKGEGPGEFSVLARALPTRSGGVLAFNAFDRGAVFDSAGRVKRTFRMPLESLYEARSLDDTLMLLAGPLPERDASPERARLHVWNLANGKVVRSFFQPRVRGRAHSLAANTTGLVSMDLHRDTIAATFGISDTIYFFNVDGRILRKVPIPFRHFRPVSERRRIPRRDDDLVVAREWVGTFSFITRVFWLRDGTLLVQYQDRKGLEPHWRLLGMTAEGALLFDVVETPHLIQVDPATGMLYFQKPGSLIANVWTEATLRR
ncbi:MAG: hypothetical protein ACJ8GN_13380 [Longimicrobiaceae bacterium]